MQLIHDTSSLQINDTIDPVYGKYFPAEKQPCCPHFQYCIAEGQRDHVRIFTEVYGVFGNLTKRFAERLDNLKIPCEKNCVVKENFLSSHFSVDVLAAIAEEPGFWFSVEKYPWFWVVFEELYKMSSGDVYLLADWEFGHQLSDRYTWIRKSFGETMAERVFFTCDQNRPMLLLDRQDVLIDCDLSNIERWVKAGGSGYYWPEIHWQCADVATILGTRISMLENMVKSLVKK